MQKHRTGIWRIREPRGTSLVELMLVCTVSTILVTRAYLAVTGYPQIGGTTLHIAHMLWGGLLMLVGALIFFQAADRIWKPFVAILFGIGLGLFIDETGKFVTKDNDYFFQPTVAIIYVILLVVLISARLIGRIDRQTPEENLYFAAETLARSFVGPISTTERTLALRRIEQSGLMSPDIDRLRQALEGIKTSHEDDSEAWQTWDALWANYQNLLAGQRFQRFIFVVILLHTISYILIVIFYRNQSFPDTFVDWLDIGWQSVVALLLISGIVSWLRGHQLTALRLFYYSMLIMLLIGQVFIFASSQFYGLIELFINVSILVGLRSTIASQIKASPNQTI